mmetsp:Transcript_15391/g.42230  ORF Transcript_15391/g.42230 Transcript_15391/m.42230 type:complete len:258 (-) Transcript_15391:2-775(-)
MPQRNACRSANRSAAERSRPCSSERSSARPRTSPRGEGRTAESERQGSGEAPSSFAGAGTAGEVPGTDNLRRMPAVLPPQRRSARSSDSCSAICVLDSCRESSSSFASACRRRVSSRSALSAERGRLGERCTGGATGEAAARSPLAPPSQPADTAEDARRVARSRYFGESSGAVPNMSACGLIGVAGAPVDGVSCIRRCCIRALSMSAAWEHAALVGGVAGRSTIALGKTLPGSSRRPAAAQSRRKHYTPRRLSLAA